MNQHQQTDPHYIKQLVATADTHAIEAKEDIFNEQGTKLISAGTRIDDSYYQKIVRHKLVKPIDVSLGIEHGVTVDGISCMILDNPANDDIIGFLLKAFRDNTLPSRTIRHIRLSGPLSVKLTVTQEREPRKFIHSLQVALAALYIGYCEQLEEEALTLLMTAGLFHDLGEMHIDPRISDRSTALSPELRRQIYAHPVIAYLIIKECPEYPADVSQAVLEHHERLDGSGYPRGVKGEQISLFGRVLAVADLIVAMLSRSSDRDYLATSMKLNTGKYDKTLLQHVLALFKNSEASKVEPENKPQDQTAELWSKLAHLLVRIPLTQSEVTPEEKAAQAFIEEHTQTLRQIISSAGINPDNIDETVKQLMETTEETSELHSMAFESLYRIHELLNETRRRWPSLFIKEENRTSTTPLSDWLLLCEERLEFLIASEH